MELDMDDDIQETESVGSFGEALREALSADTQDEAEVTTETETEVEASTEVEVEVLAEATDEDSEGEDLPDSLSAPDDWSDDDKALFGSATPEQQGFLLRRHKELEAGATRKFQEASDLRKRYEPLDDVLKPYEQQFLQAGATTPQVISQLLQLRQFAVTDPGGFAKWATAQAKTRGVQVEQPTSTNQYDDPEISDLKSQVDALRAEQQSAVRRQQEQAQRENAALIQSFQDEKDADGNDAHPHFDAVRAEMSGLMTSGAAPDLASAYEMSVRANPELYQKLLDEQLSAKEAALKDKSEQERKAKLATARKQPAKPGKAKGTVESKGLSIFDEVRERVQASK
jgi:hypothetical protein